MSALWEADAWNDVLVIGLAAAPIIAGLVSDGQDNEEGPSSSSYWQWCKDECY